jgi:hypothetical protein
MQAKPGSYFYSFSPCYKVSRNAVIARGVKEKEK